MSHHAAAGACREPAGNTAGAGAESSNLRRAVRGLLPETSALAVSTMAGVYLTGANFGAASHYWFIPMMFRQSSATELRRDVFISTLADSSPTLFWRLAGALPGSSNPDTLFVIGGVLFFALTVLALWHLGSTLIGDRAGPVVAMLLAGGPASLFQLACAQLDHSLAAFPLIVLGISLFLRGWVLPGLALVALMANFHLLHSGLALAALLGGYLLMHRPLQARVLLQSCGTVVLCALPLIYRVATQPQGLPPLSPVEQKLWYDVMCIRHDMHLFVSAWSSPHLWVAFVAPLCAALIMQYRRPEDERGRLLAGMILSLACLFVVGVVAAETRTSVTLTRMQLLRASHFIGLLAGLMVLRISLPSWRHGSHVQRIFTGAMVVSLAGGWLEIMLPVFAAGWVVAGKARESRYQWLTLGGAAALLALSMAAPHSPFRVSHAAVLLLAGWGALYFCWAALPKTPRFPWPVALLLLAALGGAVYSGRGERPVGQPPDWRAVQEWCRAHTSVDALFVTPLHEPGFRVFSHRAVVLDKTDSQVAFFEPRALLWWVERLAAFGTAPGEDWKAAYRKLSWTDLRRIGGGFGADFVVAEHRLPGSPAPEFRAGKYAVYRLPAGVR